MLTLCHWIYIAVVLAVIAMIFRRDVVMSALLEPLLMAWFTPARFFRPSGGIRITNAGRNGNLQCHTIIAIMAAMLKSWKSSGRIR